MAIDKFAPDETAIFAGQYNEQPDYAFVRFAHINTLIDRLQLNATIIPTVSYTTVGGYIGDAFSLNFSYRMNTLVEPSFYVGNITADATLRPDVLLQPTTVSPTLTGIVFNELVEANDVYFHNITPLEDITFSTLTFANSIKTLGFNTLKTLSAPALTIGQVTIDEDDNAFSISNLTSINLPNLTSSKFEIKYAGINSTLTSISLPAFSHGDVNIELEGYSALTSISFPALTTSTGLVQIGCGVNTTTLNISSLVTVRDLYIYDQTTSTTFIPSIDLHNLVSANNVEITGWKAHGLNLNSLTYVSRGLNILMSDPSVTTISLPSFIRITMEQTGGGPWNNSVHFWLSNNITTINAPVLDSGKITFIFTDDCTTSISTLNFPQYGTHTINNTINTLSVVTSGTSWNVPTIFEDLSVNFPNFINGDISYEGVQFVNNALGTPVDFIGNIRMSSIHYPSGTFYLYNWIKGYCYFSYYSPTSLEFPHLTEGVIDIQNGSSSIIMTSFYAPSFIKDDGTYDIYNQGFTCNFYNCHLTTFFIGDIGVVKQLRNLIFTYNALTLSTIDYIIDLLISLDGTNGTTLWAGTLDISGGTNAYPGSGYISKIDTLVARGATVLYND